MPFKMQRIEYDSEEKKARAEYPWLGYMEPRRVAPHVWHVAGHYDFGDYLIDTGDGLILIDSPVPQQDYLFIDSIWRAGFDPRDIKIMLISHWHFDHDGCARIIKEISGCKIYMSKEDYECKLHYPPVVEKLKMPVPYPYEVDEFYDDNTPIELGSVTIHTKLTPGHTPGVTSFFWDDTDEETGITYHVGMHGGLGIQQMRSKEVLKLNGTTCEHRDQFIDQCLELSHMDIDITLGSHLNQNGMPLVFDQCRDNRDYLPFVDRRTWPVMLLERRSEVMKFKDEEKEE